LDDFGFYESREKTTQERKYKEQQLPKQVTVVLNLSEQDSPFDLFLFHWLLSLIFTMVHFLCWGFKMLELVW
jgi:hypothetical protein